MLTGGALQFVNDPDVRKLREPGSEQRAIQRQRRTSTRLRGASTTTGIQVGPALAPAAAGVSWGGNSSNGTASAESNPSVLDLIAKKKKKGSSHKSSVVSHDFSHGPHHEEG